MNYYEEVVLQVQFQSKRILGEHYRWFVLKLYLDGLWITNNG